MYGVMDEIFKLAATFKEFLPRSSPLSSNPANVMGDTLRVIKAKRKLEETFPMLRGEEGKVRSSHGSVRASYSTR
jgi:hypothetical protein